MSVVAFCAPLGSVSQHFATILVAVARYLSTQFAFLIADNTPECNVLFIAGFYCIYAPLFRSRLEPGDKEKVDLIFLDNSHTKK